MRLFNVLTVQLQTQPVCIVTICMQKMQLCVDIRMFQRTCRAEISAKPLILSIPEVALQLEITSAGSQRCGTNMLAFPLA